MAQDSIEAAPGVYQAVLENDRADILVRAGEKTSRPHIPKHATENGGSTDLLCVFFELK